MQVILLMSPRQFRCFQTSLVILLTTYLSCVYYYHDPSKGSNTYRQPRLSKPRIWVSMGLCYSHNTQMHGKGRYPYKDVAPLALLLWRYHLPEVRTIVRIVYTEEGISSFMRVYGQMLERAGALVEWIPAGNMDCVTKSQLVRMFAGDNAEVGDSDIVVTVDINLFVMNRNVLSFLDAQSGMRAWVPQYHDTADISSGTGETFNQNLVAMTAGDWVRLTEYSEVNRDLERLVQKYRNMSVVDDRAKWYTDQLITTHTLISKKICNIPKTSGLWKMKGLQYDPDFDDSSLCWHGRGYKDCNRQVHIVYQGCKWWHFFPDQTFDEHVAKFKELSNNAIELGINVLT